MIPVASLREIDALPSSRLIWFIRTLIKLDFKFFLLILFAIPFSLVTAFGQTGDLTEKSVQWTSNSLVEKHSNESVLINVLIKTTKTEKIEILYPTETLSFRIESVDGQWIDLSQNGKLVYHVNHGTSMGKITIEKNAEISIDVDFSKENEYGLHQIFSVSNFNVE